MFLRLFLFITLASVSALNAAAAPTSVAALHVTMPTLAGAHSMRALPTVATAGSFPPPPAYPGAAGAHPMRALPTVATAGRALPFPPAYPNIESRNMTTLKQEAPWIYKYIKELAPTAEGSVTSKTSVVPDWSAIEALARNALADPNKSKRNDLLKRYAHLGTCNWLAVMPSPGEEKSLELLTEKITAVEEALTCAENNGLRLAAGVDVLKGTIGADWHKEASTILKTINPAPSTRTENIAARVTVIENMVTKHNLADALAHREIIVRAHHLMQPLSNVFPTISSGLESLFNNTSVAEAQEVFVFLQKTFTASLKIAEIIEISDELAPSLQQALDDLLGAAAFQNDTLKRQLEFTAVRIEKFGLDNGLTTSQPDYQRLEDAEMVDDDNHSLLSSIAQNPFTSSLKGSVGIMAVVATAYGIMYKRLQPKDEAGNPLTFVQFVKDEWKKKGLLFWGTIASGVLLSAGMLGSVINNFKTPALDHEDDESAGAAPSHEA